MKKTLIPVSLLGAAALFCLRFLQLKKSYDASGLIPHNDKISLALYLICAVAAAALLVICLRQPGGAQPDAGKSRLRGALVFLAGLILLASYLPPVLERSARMVLLVLAFAAACSMSVEGLFHMSGTAGSLLGGCILPVYLAASLIGNYRTWSHDPIVADFCFPLLFLVAAMLASYHLAAFRAGRGKRRTTAFLVGCALLFAGPVLADGEWRSAARALAVGLYLIAELWPYLAKPKPLPDTPDNAGNDVPAPAAGDGDDTPAPAADDGDVIPASAADDGDDTPAPAADDGDDVPAPAADDGDDVPAPAADGDLPDVPALPEE